MNKGPQPKTFLKYLLMLYAFVKSKNIQSPYGIQFTSDSKYFKMFDIGEGNASRFIDALENGGILVCSDTSYFVGEKCKKYDIITDNYKLALSANMAYYFFTDEGYVKLPFFEGLNQQIEDIKQSHILFTDNTAFNKKYERKTEQKKILNEIEQSELDYLADFIVNDMFIIREHERDVCAILKDAHYYESVLQMKHEKCHSATNRVKNVIRMLYKRTFDSLQNTTIKFDNIGADGHKILCTENELSLIKDAYIGMLINVGILNDLSELTLELHDYGYPAHCSLSIKINEWKNSLHFKYSTRQSNLYCQMEKDYRNKDNEQNGFDGEFDLHSAIYAVTRLLEKGMWGDIKIDELGTDDFDIKRQLEKLHNDNIYGCDWDIKNNLLNDDVYTKIDGQIMTRDDLKAMMFRTYFRTSTKDALNKYRNACNNDKYYIEQGWIKIGEDGKLKVPDKKYNGKQRRYGNGKERWRDVLPVISDDEFIKLSEQCELYCGEIKKYSKIIFFYESLLEYYVIRDLLRRGCAVRNVYDCFYFKTNEITVDEVKTIIDFNAVKLYYQYHCEYSEKSLW